jgi:hypothetical protein
VGAEAEGAEVAAEEEGVAAEEAEEAVARNEAEAGEGAAARRASRRDRTGWKAARAAMRWAESGSHAVGRAAQATCGPNARTTSRPRS